MSKMISYALNREDVVLNRVFSDRNTGFYIDIGAAHPDLHSTTRMFSLRGWRGLNVEPNANFYQLLCLSRPHDININAAVSDRPGRTTYYEVLDSLGESTLDEGSAVKLKRIGRPIREHQVEILTLANILERHAASRLIDFLSIDVEGHEYAVLATVDFSRWRPRVIIVEATRPGTNIPTHDKWEHLILANRYLFALFDGINRFYVREEDRDWLSALSIPANVLDNVIGQREAELVELVDQAPRYGRLATAVAERVEWISRKARRLFR